MLRLVNGDSYHTIGAIRAVESELKVIEFYEENKELLNEWSEAGIQITHENPRHAWGKTTSYGLKDDPKVATLNDIGITVTKHIKLDCHMVLIDEKGWDGPTFTHFCMDKKNHADKGTSKVKAKNQEIVASNAPDPVARAERKAAKDAKDLRRRQTAFWMSSRYNKADIYTMLLYSALSSDGWREEHVRAATWMLGLNDERPKGADYGWYSKRLNTWLDAKFGDDEENPKRLEWKVRMTHARRYIDAFWPIDLVADQISGIEIDNE
jgi:hypothetical protein